MWKNWGILVIISVATIVAVGLAVSYDLQTGRQIVARIQSVPGEKTEPAETTVSSDWREVYDLELTGLALEADDASWDGQHLAVLDVGRQQAVAVELATRNFYSLPPFPAAARAILADDGAVYLYAGAIYRLSEEADDWEPLTPSFDFPVAITKIRRFGGNFYLFGAGLIRRVSLAGGQFDALDDWLTPEAGREFGVDDAYLDGYIYLSDQGTVRRYLRGAPTGWQLEDAPAGTLYLGGDGDEALWVLAPSQSSVFLYTAGGQRQATLTDSLLAGARFVGYDADSGTIFVLIDRKIYQYAGDRLTPDNGQNVSD